MKGATSRVGAQGVSRVLPVASTLFMAMLMLLPLGSGLSGQVMPHLVLITCFYWLSSRPMLMPYGACAASGLLLDLWLGLPMGLNMALLLLSRLFVLNQLKYYRGKSRIIYWAVFSGMALVLFAMSWLIVSVVEGQFVSFDALFFQWLMTSFFYPPITFILGGVRRWIL